MFSTPFFGYRPPLSLHLGERIPTPTFRACACFFCGSGSPFPFRKSENRGMGPSLLFFSFSRAGGERDQEHFLIYLLSKRFKFSSDCSEVPLPSGSLSVLFLCYSLVRAEPKALSLLQIEALPFSFRVLFPRRWDFSMAKALPSPHRFWSPHRGKLPPTSPLVPIWIGNGPLKWEKKFPPSFLRCPACWRYHFFLRERASHAGPSFSVGLSGS